MINLDVGEYTFCIRGLPANIILELKALYPDSFRDAIAFPDYVIDVKSTSLLRRLFRPQVSISIDGHQPFNPIPPSKLLPSIEWAMNWCIAAYDHSKLLIHCSVIEKNGKVILFPAQSGSGKSTTSAYLSLKGWHLYFDEMAVIDLTNGEVMPVYRPCSLKNNSIEIIKPFVKKGHLSKVTQNTHKGSIAHLMPTNRSEFNKLKPLPAFACVFLDFNTAVRHSISEVDKAIGFSKIIANAFNYSVIGEPAFDVLKTIADTTHFYDVSYSHLDEIEAMLEEVISGDD